MIANLLKPEGFFDPKVPAGTATPPERDPSLPPLDPDAPPDPRYANMLAFANSDLAFSGTHLFLGNFHGFNTYDIERPSKPQLIASIVCPGGQGDVSVHGNLLFMSVEQTRGRVDCGTAGRRGKPSATSGSAASASSTSAICKKPKQVAAVQTCRGSHTHTLVTDPKDKANLYVYGSGTGAVRSGEELAGCSGQRSEGGSEHGALQHRRDQGAARGAGEGDASSTGRASSPTRRPARIAGLWAGGDHGPGTQKTSATNQCHDITVFPGDRPGRRRLLGQRHPARHPRSGAPGAPRRRGRQELRLLALGDVQQRRHQGDLHRRVGRRHAPALPRDRSARPGAPTRSSTSSTSKLAFGGYYKMPAAQTEQENCVAHNGSLIPVPGPRHHGAGVVPGRRVGVRLHRLGAPGGDRLLRPRSDRREEPDHRRLLVDLLVQRQHLRLRDRARHRRLQADAERVPLAERDRRGHAGADRGVQRAAAAEDHVAGRAPRWRGRTSIS